MKKGKDCAGIRYGLLLGVERVGSDRNNQATWLCRCDCGKTTITTAHSLRSGNTRSCGCLRDATAKNQMTKHGMYKSPEYTSWKSMVRRCTDEKSAGFHNYGARGISVCDRWLSGFEAFYEDMGDRPTPTHSLDRIDNDGNYEPSNCRWATPSEQSRNKRQSRLVLFDGKRVHVSELAGLHDIKPGTLWERIKRGWTIEKALSTPPDNRRSDGID